MIYKPFIWTIKIFKVCQIYSVKNWCLFWNHSAYSTALLSCAARTIVRLLHNAAFQERKWQREKCQEVKEHTIRQQMYFTSAAAALPHRWQYHNWTLLLPSNTTTTQLRHWKYYDIYSSTHAHSRTHQRTHILPQQRHIRKSETCATDHRTTEIKHKYGKKSQIL
jgi:hypothetical protein